MIKAGSVIRSIYDAMDKLRSDLKEAGKYQNAAVPPKMDFEYDVAKMGAMRGVDNAASFGCRMFNSGHGAAHVEDMIADAVKRVIVNVDGGHWCGEFKVKEEK